MSQPRQTPLNYETARARGPGVSVWVSVTMIVCGTALLLAPWMFLNEIEFRFLFSNVLKAMLVFLTLAIGTAMIALGYLHARR
jgi:hypothetical protein